jgi:hypothetical protein
MKAYVASRFTNKIYVAAFMMKCYTMQPVSGELILFTNTWQTADIGASIAIRADPVADHAYQLGCAARDIKQLDDADMIIVLTDGCEAVSGGMHFEAGYAYAKGKRLIVIGPRVNVFYHMDDVEWYPDAAAFLEKNYVSVLDGK